MQTSTLKIICAAKNIKYTVYKRMFSHKIDLKNSLRVWNGMKEPLEYLPLEASRT